MNSARPAEPELDAYDEEQVRLMEERCILVNDKDEAYGEDSKKTCELRACSASYLLRSCF